MKNILVTGANRGIGLEIVRQLASDGHQLYLTARDKTKGAAATESLKKQGLPVEFLQVDVSQQKLTEKSDIKM